MTIKKKGRDNFAGRTDNSIPVNGGKVNGTELACGLRKRETAIWGSGKRA